MALAPNLNWLGYATFIVAIFWPLVVGHLLMTRDLIAYGRSIFFSHDMTFSALSALAFFAVLSWNTPVARFLAKEKEMVLQTQRSARYSVCILIVGLVFTFTVVWVVKE